MFIWISFLFWCEESLPAFLTCTYEISLYSVWEFFSRALRIHWKSSILLERITSMYSLIFFVVEISNIFLKFFLRYEYILARQSCSGTSSVLMNVSIFDRGTFSACGINKHWFFPALFLPKKTIDFESRYLHWRSFWKAIRVKAQTRELHSAAENQSTRPSELT